MNTDSVNNTGKSFKSTFLGAVILVFAIIGVISSAVFLTNTAINIIENQDEKNMFADYITPLVIQDPPPFDSVDNLEPKTVLAAAVWNLLANEDISKYDTDEFGFLSVPSTDIEAYAAKLFGPGLVLQHQTFGDATYSIAYDETNKIYNVPSTSLFPTYTARVTNIAVQDNKYTLTVDYLSTGNIVKNSSNKESPARKTMYYLLEKDEDENYRIVSVKSNNQAGESQITSSNISSDVSSAASTAVSSAAAVASDTSSSVKSSSKAVSSSKNKSDKKKKSNKKNKSVKKKKSKN